MTPRTSIRPSWWVLALLGCSLASALKSRGAEPSTTATVPVAEATRVIEAAGTVEVRTGRGGVWRVAVPGTPLRPGDWLRTGDASRAAVLLSDRAVVRLAERTTFELQPPRASEKRRFGLIEGLLFFFHRDKPTEVEFESPIATGAIRGTEFVLAAEPPDGRTRLALLDGRVELTSAGTTLELNRGEEGRVEPGRAPERSPLIEATRVVQWALYYPAVVVPEDLALAPDDEAALRPALEAYRSGDLLGAHRAAAAVPPGGPARALFRAALDLAVGRVAAAEARLAGIVGDPPAARALRELIATVRDGPNTPEGTPPSGPVTDPVTASEWLARSYRWQGQYRWEDARAAARHATRLAPASGFAWTRLAELWLGSDRATEALAALDQATRLAPRLAEARALVGYAQLDARRVVEALAAFDEALALDAGLGNAWLGRGLALMRLRRKPEALTAFETAAALEPRRSLPRSYLGKAFAELGEADLARKEFRLARELDPADPTPSFYEALHAAQENRPNAAVALLERSVADNDHRQVYRSRFGLDRDRAVRQANLAGLYRDAGLPEAGRVAAVRALADDPVGFESHLFLANAYRAMEDPSRFDLRLESARQSEWLVANLLAPPESANLSQLASQQEYLRFFNPRPLAGTSFTEYRDTGDWRQEFSAYGALGGFGYAVDAVLDRQNGQEIHDAFERRDVSVQAKQRLGLRDEAYVHVGLARSEAGDIARHYDPATAVPGRSADEEQMPNLHAGWHHAWSEASHTLVLVSRLTDDLERRDPEASVLFLRRSGADFVSASTPPLFASTQDSRFELYSGEVQHLWQRDDHAVVAGVRGQAGDVESLATLERPLTGVVTTRRVEEPLRRGTAYAYHQWHVARPLRLVGGLAYDRLTHPSNTEIPPLADGRATREHWGPKAGVFLEPWEGGLWRAGWSRSLGGAFFDQSVRLEPAQVAGFPQAFRSLLPESAAGIAPGTAFETVHVAFDQVLPGRRYLGIEAGYATSDGDRVAGVLTNALPLPIPDSPSTTRQTLEYRERTLALYAVQLVGDGLSLGARYRLSEARLETGYPDLPPGLPGLERLATTESGVLHQLALSAGYRHASGWFAQWESHWYQQENDGFDPARPGDEFWQHHVYLGYRWPRHRAEVRAGVMNLTDVDYRLSPLNTYADPTRQRTVVIRLRLHF